VRSEKFVEIARAVNDTHDLDDVVNDFVENEVVAFHEDPGGWRDFGPGRSDLGKAGETLKVGGNPAQ